MPNAVTHKWSAAGTGSMPLTRIAESLLDARGGNPTPVCA